MWVYATAILGVFFVIATYYAFKFALMILRVQDALEESLDVIDEKYASITAICERPLFYDSPEVRQVLADIKDTRWTLHQIAIALSKDFEAPDDTKEAGSFEG